MKYQIIEGTGSWLSLCIGDDTSRMPSILKGHEIVCGLDQGNGEELYICESFKDIKALRAEHASGRAVSISWYQKPTTAIS